MQRWITSRQQRSCKKKKKNRIFFFCMHVHYISQFEFCIRTGDRGAWPPLVSVSYNESANRLGIYRNLVQFVDLIIPQTATVICLDAWNDEDGTFYRVRCKMSVKQTVNRVNRVIHLRFYSFFACCQSKMFYRML